MVVVVLAAAAVLLVLRPWSASGTGAATPTATAHRSSGSPDQQVSSGPVTVTYPSSAFPAGAKPRITLDSGRSDDFLTEFALPGTPTVVADVQAAAQPTEPVQVSFAVDLSALPAHSTPSVFYQEPTTGLWLPVPTTVDSATGRLVGTSTHFTSFVAALTTVVDKVDGVVESFRYQLASALGARAQAPSCSSNSEATKWVIIDEQPPALNDPLPACLEFADNGDAELHVVVNRGFSLSLSGPVKPSKVAYEPGVDTARALYETIAKTFGNRQDVFLPAHVEAVLTYPRGSLPQGAVTLQAAPSALSMAADPIVALADAFGTGKLPGSLPDLVDAMNCLQGHIEYVASPQIGSAVADAAGCLDAVVDELEGDAQVAAKKIMTSLKVVQLAAKATQNTVDELMDLNEDEAVHLRVLPTVPVAPAGSVYLSDVVQDNGGVGPSGDVVDQNATISGKLATHSTSQWVGCEGTPAWADYALGGHTRLTAWLGFRSFAEAGLMVQVTVLVDGRTVSTLMVGLDGTSVDQPLPAGQTLRLEAQLVGGTCGSHDEGYMAWGDGALS